MTREWTPEQKAAASDRMKKMNEAKKMATTRSKIRQPIGAKREITNVHDTPEGYVDRWVNDDGNRINQFKNAGYENVHTAEMGSSGVEGTHDENGVVSKDMGKGVTAYLMRQRKEYFDEDQSEKQKIVDESEESMRKKEVKPQDSTDGTYGKVHVG